MIKVHCSMASSACLTITCLGLMLQRSIGITPAPPENKMKVEDTDTERRSKRSNKSDLIFGRLPGANPVSNHES